MGIIKEIEQKYIQAEAVIQNAQAQQGGVYIDRLEGNSDVEFDIDVGRGEIAFSIVVNKTQYSEECAYSSLVNHLRSKGIHVYENYCDRGCNFCPSR